MLAVLSAVYLISMVQAQAGSEIKLYGLFRNGDLTLNPDPKAQISADISTLYLDREGIWPGSYVKPFSPKLYCLQSDELKSTSLI